MNPKNSSENEGEYNPFDELMNQSAEFLPVTSNEDETSKVINNLSTDIGRNNLAQKLSVDLDFRNFIATFIEPNRRDLLHDNQVLQLLSAFISFINSAHGKIKLNVVSIVTSATQYESEDEMDSLNNEFTEALDLALSSREEHQKEFPGWPWSTESNPDKMEIYAHEEQYKDIDQDNGENEDSDVDIERVFSPSMSF